MYLHSLFKDEKHKRITFTKKKLVLTNTNKTKSNMKLMLCKRIHNTEKKENVLCNPHHMEMKIGRGRSNQYYW